jgi:hypothetical protein
MSRASGTRRSSQVAHHLTGGEARPIRALQDSVKTLVRAHDERKSPDLRRAKQNR